MGNSPYFLRSWSWGLFETVSLEFRSEPWQKPRMSSEAEGRFPRPSWRFEETALPPRMLHPRRNGLEEFPILVPLLVPGSAWRRRFRFAWGSLATGSFPKTFKSAKQRKPEAKPTQSKANRKQSKAKQSKAKAKQSKAKAKQNKVKVGWVPRTDPTKAWQPWPAKVKA